MVKFSVIIVSYNNLELLKKCLDSLYETNSNELEIIVVDNNSNPDVIEYLDNQNRIKLIKNNFNAGFAKATNQAAKIAYGYWFVLLNNDTVIERDFFIKAGKFLQENPEYSIMGPLVLSPDGFPQPTFFNKDYYRQTLFPSYSFRRLIKVLSFNNNEFKKKILLFKCSANYSFVIKHETESLSAVCLFINRKVYNNIGLFDENYYMYVEDMDFCLRAKRNNYKIVFYPEIIITHFIKEIKHKPTVNWFQFNNHLKYFFKKNFPWYINILAQLVLSFKAFIKIIIIKTRL